jgi:hypothetical protein
MRCMALALMRQSVLRWVGGELIGQQPVMHGPLSQEDTMQVVILEQSVVGAWGAPWGNLFLSEVATPWARDTLFLRERGLPPSPLDPTASISSADFALVHGQAGFESVAGAPYSIRAAALVGALSDAWFASRRGL